MKKILCAMVLTTICAGAATAFVAGGRAGSRFALTRTLPRTKAAGSSHTVRMMSSSAVEFVKSEIASNNVMVFSKSYCPFCTATKNVLSDMNANAKVLELDQMDNGAEIQAALLEVSGQRTVPNVFIKGKHLGGNDDTQAAARTGKLGELIAN